MSSLVSLWKFSRPSEFYEDTQGLQKSNYPIIRPHLTEQLGEPQMQRREERGEDAVNGPFRINLLHNNDKDPFRPA